MGWRDFEIPTSLHDKTDRTDKSPVTRQRSQRIDTESRQHHRVLGSATLPYLLSMQRHPCDLAVIDQRPGDRHSDGIGAKFDVAPPQRQHLVGTGAGGRQEVNERGQQTARVWTGPHFLTVSSITASAADRDDRSALIRRQSSEAHSCFTLRSTAETQYPASRNMRVTIRPSPPLGP